MAVDFLNENAFSPDDDAQFRSGAAYPSILWYSQMMTEDGETINGFCIPLGTDFDEMAQTVKGKLVTIIHDASNQDSRFPSQKRADGKPSNYKDYWLFESLDLFLLIKGLKAPLETQGVVSTWDDVNKKSHLKLCVMVKNFLEAGYSTPFILSVSGKGRTIALNTILRIQQSVLVAYKEYVYKAKGTKPSLPMWAFSIPVGKGKVVAVGKEQKKNMILPEAKVPDVIGEAYFKANYVTQCVLGDDAISFMRETVEDTVKWAIGAMEAQSQQQAQQTSDAPVNDDGSDIVPDEVELTVGDNDKYKPAVEGQRKALANLAKQPGNEMLGSLATAKSLTFNEAKDAITAAQKRK